MELEKFAWFIRQQQHAAQPNEIFVWTLLEWNYIVFLFLQEFRFNQPQMYLIYQRAVLVISQMESKTMTLVGPSTLDSGYQKLVQLHTRLSTDHNLYQKMFFPPKYVVPKSNEYLVEALYNSCVQQGIEIPEIPPKKNTESPVKNKEPAKNDESA